MSQSGTGMPRRGIILAGGSGTRLYPVTRVVSKQLLPIYDKPMIYYPLRTLMLAGIRDILIISTPQDTPLFQQLLGDGSQWGLRLHYAVQPTPGGLAQALHHRRASSSADAVALILGDNMFYGHGLPELLRGRQSATERRHGVCAITSATRSATAWWPSMQSRPRDSIEEKPAHPKSSFAVTGLVLLRQSRAGNRRAPLHPRRAAS